MMMIMKEVLSKKFVSILLHMITYKFWKSRSRSTKLLYNSNLLTTRATEEGLLMQAMW